MNAGIYIRVSTKKQEDGFSLDDQLKRGRERCRIEGLTLTEDLIFQDAASGTSTDRTEYQRLLESLPKFAGGRLVFTSIDRLSRDTIGGLELIKALREHEIVPISTDGQLLKIDSPEDELAFTVILAAAKYVARKNRDNANKGQREGRSQGFWTRGEPAYGFTIGQYQDTKHRILVPDRPGVTNGHTDSEYPIIRRARDLLVDGIGQTTIAEIFNSEGKRTRWGKKFIQRSIAKMFAPNRTELIGWVQGADRSDPANSRHEAIFTEQEWDEVQRLFNRTGERRGKHAPAFLLDRLMVCGCCGERMGCRTDGDYQVYRCHGRARLRNGCQMPPMPRRPADEEVLAMIDQRLAKFTAKEKTAADAAKAMREAKELAIKAAEAEIRKLDKRLKELDQELVDGVSLKTYEAAVAMVNTKRIETAERLAGLAASLAEFSEPQMTQQYRSLAETIFDPQRSPHTAVEINRALKPFVNFRLDCVPLRDETELLAHGELYDIPAVAEGREPGIARVVKGDWVWRIVPVAVDSDLDVNMPDYEWDPDYEDEEGKGGWRQVGSASVEIPTVCAKISGPGAGSDGGAEESVSVVTACTLPSVM